MNSKNVRQHMVNPKQEKIPMIFLRVTELSALKA